MFDSRIRPWIDRPLNKVAAFLARHGLRAQTVTWAGFAIGVAGCLCLAAGAGLWAAALILFNRVADGLDGALARARGEAGDFGGYLDITLDYFIYAGVPFAGAIGIGGDGAALAAAFVIYSFIGSGVTFLAFAVHAAKRRLNDSGHQGKKSFYFAFGLMEGAETVAFMLAVCLFPAAFLWLCYGFGVLCWLTAIARIAAARQLFK